MPHLDETPARSDRHEDVHPPAAGGLGIGLPAEFGQQVPRGQRGTGSVGEVAAGGWIEVQPQLIRQIDLGGPHRPWMEGDGSHLCRPDDSRGFVGRRAHLDRGAAGRERDFRGADPVRRPPGDSLGVEAVLTQSHPRVYPFGPALQSGRPPPDRRQQPGGDSFVVLGHVPLGGARGREYHPIRARDAHGPPAELDRER